jgi:hypothetical protein
MQVNGDHNGFNFTRKRGGGGKGFNAEARREEREDGEDFFIKERKLVYTYRITLFKPGRG